MMLQHDTRLTLVSEITFLTGKAVSTATGILQEFQRYYQCLYTSTLPPDLHTDSLNSLLDPMALGWLSDEGSSHLVHRITPEEIISVVKSLSGPDGLPAEFYKNHVELLTPLLAFLYKHCLSEGGHPPSLHD